MQSNTTKSYSAKVPKDLLDLVPGFLNRRREEIKELFSCAKKCDYEKCAFIAHSLKGHAAGYGFIDLGDMAIMLEDAANQRDEGSLLKIINEIDGYISNVNIIPDTE